MSTVGMPISTMLSTRQKPRPLVSPRCPNMRAPAGRDRKPTAYTPQKERAWRAGSSEGKKTLLNSLLSCV
jgi:hypothetical protein